MVIINGVPEAGSFYAISSCKAENRKYCAINLSNNYINHVRSIYDPPFYYKLVGSVYK